MEKAIEMDRDGHSRVLADRAFRHYFARWDAWYSWVGDSIEAQRGPDAEMSFLLEKAELFDYLPTNPLLCVMYKIACYSSNSGRKAAAIHWFQKLLNAEPVTDDKSEQDLKNSAKDELQAMKGNETSAGPEPDYPDGGEVRPQATAAVACYNHPERPAVATCHKGCGKNLCQECAGRIEPPTCRECVERVMQGAYSEVIGKLVVNVFFLVSYAVPLWLLFNGTLEPGPGKQPEGWAVAVGVVCAVLWLVWGFVALGWFARQLFGSLAPHMVMAGTQTYGCMYIIGAVVLGSFGALVIPWIILGQIVQLIRLRRQSARLLG